MRDVEGCDHLSADIDHFRQLELSGSEAFAQRCAIDILAGNKMQRLRIAKLEDRQNIRLVERRSQLGLLFESLHPPFVRGDVRRQDLQSYGAIEAGVLRQVNFSHSARAKLLDDAVMI